MKSIVYAQNGEDILLNRFLGWRNDGFYIDVGANDPVVYSVTKAFSRWGWHGINIEPITPLYERLCRDRPRDLNLNIGLANASRVLTFYEVWPDEEGIYSTFSLAEAENRRSAGLSYQERQVPVLTLAEVCERHVDRTIDFLSIDVEGLEREVLEGGDFHRWRPRVILIEAVVPCTATPCHEQWEDLLLGADYLYATFDGINRYYVRAEDRESLPLLTTPRYDRPLFIHYEEHRQIQLLEATLHAEQMGRRQAEEALAAAQAGLGLSRSRNAVLQQSLSATRNSLREVLAQVEKRSA